MVKILDRRSICAVRLDGRRRKTRIVCNDPGSLRSAPPRSCWVARLASGTLLVTSR